MFAFDVVPAKFKLIKYMKKQKIIITSVGHSNKTIEVFLDALKKHSVQVLVDVRTIPRSRFCPHFNQNALQDTLAKRTIKYLYRGLNLGGRGVNVGYEEAIEELVELARQGIRVCVMCSEADYHDCHRYSTLTPSFHERDVEVSHIEYAKTVTGGKKLTPQTPQKLKKSEKVKSQQKSLL